MAVPGLKFLPPPVILALTLRVTKKKRGSIFTPSEQQATYLSLTL
jgi:hypothetical protein